MAKKSLFEKLGLVESAAPEVDLAALQAQAASYQEMEETPVLDIDFEGEDFLTVEELYEKAGLADTSKSIFKVEEFSKVLPENLPTDVRRQSVIGILTASGLELDGLLEDANQRLDSLEGLLSVTSQNTVEFITEKETEISELLQRVDSLKQLINDRKSSQEQQNKIAQEEQGKINEIVKFVTN
jgi:hypothetical protein